MKALLRGIVAAARQLVTTTPSGLAFSTVNVASPLSLSNSDTRLTLAAGNTSIAKTIRGVKPMRSGKWYWEFKVVNMIPGSGTTSGVGLCNASHPSASANIATGANAKSVGYWASGNVYNSGSALGTGAAYTSGDTLMFALDKDSGLVWWGKNGTWDSSGNPGTGANPKFSTLGTGEAQYPAACPWSADSSATVIDLVPPASFLYSVPSGFSAYNEVVAEPAEVGAHRFWRLLVMAGTSYVQLKNFEMYATVGGSTDLCAGGTAFANAALSGYEADKAFDSPSSGSGWATNSKPCWVGYDFGTPVAVAEYSLFFPTGSEAPSDFAFQYSDDSTTGLDGSWVTVERKTGHTLAIGTQERFAVPAGAALTDPHLAWRFKVTTKSGYMQLTELSLLDAFGVNQVGGGVAFGSTSNLYSGSSPANAFDGTNLGWTTQSDGQPRIVAYVFAHPVDVVTYMLKFGIPSEAPTDWTFEHSDDTTNGLDGTWTVADTQSGQSFASVETQVFTVP